MADLVNDMIFSLYKDQPIYRELLQEFVGCLDERFIESRKAFDEKSWKALSSTMHQLRGAAATYGFPMLSAIAASIELDSLEATIPEERIGRALIEIGMTCRKIEAGMAQLLSS